MKQFSPRKKLASALAVAGVLVIALSACTGNNPAPKDDTLTWAKPAELLTPDPSANGTGGDWEFYNAIFDTLVSLDEDNQPAPGLAESWTHPSPTVYEFVLRDNAAFSNGRKLTPDDVVGTLERVMAPETASSWATQLNIESAEATGDNGVRVTLTKPTGGFLAALACGMVSILPIAEIESGEIDPTTEMVGTGPYMVKSHTQGQSWTLVRNPEYWGEPAKAATVEIKIVTDDSARLAALRSGTADVATFASPDAVALLEGQPNITSVVQDTTDYYRLDVSGITSIFKDPRMRQALALSLDRESIADIGLAGLGNPTAAIVPSFDVCDASKMPLGVTDLDAAKALVEESGNAGATVGIIASTANAAYAPIAQVIQQNLETIGLKVEIQQLDPGAWVDTVFNGKTADFDLAMSYSSVFADPGMVLPYWNPAYAPFATAYLNDNPSLDEDIDAVTATDPGAERDAAILSACEKIAQDANVIPLVTKPNIIAYRSDQVEVDLYDTEVYSVPLRKLATYLLK